MYLISVYFDEAANRTLEGYINKIAEKTGNKFMTDNNVPPHMTISAIEARNIEVLVPKFEELRGKLFQGKINIVSIGQLLPYVFYATPVLNGYLQKLSEKVYEAMKNIPETTISRYYKPMSWLPHITLGKTLTKTQMETAFEAMQDSFIPLQAEITEIGLARVNPHEDVVRWKLFDDMATAECYN